MYLTRLDTRWALGNILGNTQLPFARHILYTSSIDLTSDSQFWLVTICACWPLNLHTILSYVSKLNLLVYIPIICICVWVWVGMGMMCMDMDMYVCWLFALIFSFFCVEIPGDSWHAQHCDGASKRCDGILFHVRFGDMYTITYIYMLLCMYAIIYIHIFATICVYIYIYIWIDYNELNLMSPEWW